MEPDDVVALKNQAVAEAAAAADLEALEQVRVAYLGRKGRLAGIMGQLGRLDPAQRPAFGQRANELKDALQEAIGRRRAELAAARPADRADRPDLTLPGRWRGLGRRHPITAIAERMAAIFRAMGFTMADGPDVETAYHNFDALNHPANHPARDPQDTFYLEGGELLRTHTSPVQVRHMEAHRPPVRIVAAGRCYRRDTPDATHSANFHQLEGLYVDEGVSLADLKGDIAHFARRLVGPAARVRFRPHFFPFTEPSVEVDFSCHVCGGRGCRVCKQEGWIEIMGAGLVDPNVFARVGYDPERISGYAFGMGVERLAMILYGLDDIRLLYENDMRYLRQF